MTITVDQREKGPAWTNPAPDLMDQLGELGVFVKAQEKWSPLPIAGQLSDAERAAAVEELIEWALNHDPAELEEARKEAWRRD